MDHLLTLLFNTLLVNEGGRCFSVCVVAFVAANWVSGWVA